MNHSLQQAYRRIKDDITRPELRRSFHYDCSLYRGKAAATPLVSLRMDHQCRTPLWRILAIASALTLIIVFVRAFGCRLSRGKQIRRTCE